jgi:hypothetical protein
MRVVEDGYLGKQRLVHSLEVAAGWLTKRGACSLLRM